MFDLFSKKKHKIAMQYIDYTYQFFGDYTNDMEFNYFVKKFDYKQRLKFVINTYKNDIPSPKKYFILALAYFQMPVEYIDYTIFYAEKYLSGPMWNKHLKLNLPIEKEWNLQQHLFNYILGCCYSINGDYKTALKYGFRSKAGNLYDMFYFNPFLLIANCYYCLDDYDKAINNLYDGYRNMPYEYQKKNCLDLINKYEKYKAKNHHYKKRNKPQIRRDIKTGLLYDLNTGEFIE